MSLQHNPEKHFYTIGDVSRLTSVKPHVLRYWESQFKLLLPARRYSGHRKYTQREIDLIQKIKVLLIDRKFTLAGAKREINRQLTGHAPQDPGGTAVKNVSMDALREIKKDVDECLALFQPLEIPKELAALK